MRSLTYAQAIREAHAQLLGSDPRVFVFGQGLWSPWYAGETLLDLETEFGRDRVIDSTVAENATTAAAIGAAIAGMRPIVFHPRMDFMLLAADPIINQASNWSYLFGGQVSAPVVIRATINRGGQQGAQHSQALQALFAHVPGIKVVMPSTPYDAKGLLISAVSDGNPVMYIDDRWLYDETGEVPEEMYTVAIGKASVRRKGKDITIVASSYAALLSEKVCRLLEKAGIDAELIDVRSIKPLDENTILESVKKTGSMVIVDGAWRTCGVAAEISATVAEKAYYDLNAPIKRVTLPDVPAPVSKLLEAAYYFTVDDIVCQVKEVLEAVKSA